MKRPFIVRGKEIHFIQGGMAYKISWENLPIAVANAYFLEQGDCVGTIAASLCGIDNPKYIRDPEQIATNAFRGAIREFRKKSNGILAVNIMMAITNFDILMRVAVEEGVDIIIMGAGLALDAPKYLKSYSKTKLALIVSSARAAVILCKKWLKSYRYLPHAFVVEGPLAGGHLGFKEEEINDPKFALEVLVAEVLEAIKPFEVQCGKIIPVFVGGGITSGNDMHHFLKLGASGFQLASPLVPTHECDAASAFKQVYLDAGENDAIIIKSPVGLPGRAFINNFLEKIMRGERNSFKCLYRCLKNCNPSESPYCIAQALLEAQRGNLDKGFVFTGAKGYQATRIRSVEEVLRTLREELRIAQSPK